MYDRVAVATGHPRKEAMTNPILCEWFALCDREADHLVRHPILGDVPTCERCVEKLNLRDAVVATRADLLV